MLSRNPGEPLLVWAWQHYPVYRGRCTAAMGDPANAHLRFVRITSGADLRRLLAGG